MAVRQDKVQVEVEINGQKAGASINELQKSYRQLNRERNQLTIGTEEYVKKTEALKEVKGRLDDVKNEVKGINEENKSVFQSFLALTPFEGQFNDLADSFGNVKGKVGGATTGFKTLRGAIMSTGIGALVVLLGSLITYLTSTQEGMDKVTAVTRPLMAIFEKMKGVVQELGGSVFKGLAQIMNGDLQAGLETLKNGFTEAGKASVDAFGEGWKAGTKLDQMQKAIERNEIDMIKRRKELELQAKQMNFIVEDETKSYDERRAAAKAALQAQDELQTMLIDHMDKKIEKMKLEHTLNDTSREDEKELAELEAQRAEMAASVVEMRTTMRNKLNVLNKAEAAETQKLIDEEAKAREALRQKEIEAEEALQALRIQVRSEGLERELALLELEHERKMEAVIGNEQQKNEARLLLQEEFEAKKQEATLAWEEAEKKRIEEKEAAEAEIQAEKEELELLKLEEKYANALMKEAEYEEARYELMRANLERKMEMLTENNQAESIEYQRAATELAKLDQDRINQKLDQEKKAADQLEKIREGSYQAAKSFVDLGLELLAEEEDGKKKQNKAYQAFAIAQIGLNLAEEMSGIWKNANAVYPTPLNIAIGVAQSGLAVARASKAIGKVTAAKYEKGGVLGGSRHSEGGNLVIDSQTGQTLAELEAGEPYLVLSRNTYANNRGVIDMLLHSSQHRNGAPIYESGGIVNPYRTASTAAASGGSAAGSAAADAMNYGPQMIAELQALRAAMAAMPRNIRAYLVYSDLEETQQEVAEVRAEAQVRGEA